MVVLFLLILLVVLLIMLIIRITALKINLELDTQSNIFYVSFTWCYPLIKSFVFLEKTRPVLEVYVLKKKVFSRKISIKSNNSDKKRFIDISDFQDVCIDICYGFSNPAFTGAMNGFINMLYPIRSIKKVENNADFTAMDDYVSINAEGNVDIAHQIVKYLKLKYI